MTRSWPKMRAVPNRKEVERGLGIFTGYRVGAPYVADRLDWSHYNRADWTQDREHIFEPKGHASSLAQRSLLALEPKEEMKE